jgi:hypothetical protein
LTEPAKCLSAAATVGSAHGTGGPPEGEKGPKGVEEVEGTKTGMIVHGAHSCMTGGRLALPLAALLLALPGAMASPLDKESCDKLKLEQGQLEQEGVRANMAKGPEWAKGNLKPEQLEQIRRVIELDGQVLFRCNGRPLVTLPKDLEEPREDGSEPSKAKEENAPRPAPEQAAPGKDAAAPDKAGQPKAKAPASAKEAGVAAGTKAKAKAKPKADDAFKPPVTDPLADPFASQLPPEGKK